MISIIKLMRIKQYVKNLFIFIPIFFSGKITDLFFLRDVSLTFVFFSVLASSVYIINDVIDSDDDKKHPVKKNRPIASGLVSKRFAVLVSIILLLISLICTFLLLGYIVTLVFLLYFIVNLFYCFVLKHIAIIDIFIIGFGFVIRILVGSIVCIAPLSEWIIVMVFMLSLFMGFAKRRDDVIYYIKDGTKMRSSVDGYNIELINSLMTIIGAVIIVAYIMYTLSPDVAAFKSPNFIYTTLWVIIAIFRYFQLSLVFNKTGSPTEILYKDRIIQMCILLWGLMVGYFIYI